MVVFAYISMYLMPIIAYLFILSFLRAIKKIFKNKPYTAELFWSGLFFALIAWTISIFALFGTE